MIGLDVIVKHTIMKVHLRTTNIRKYALAHKLSGFF